MSNKKYGDYYSKEQRKAYNKTSKKAMRTKDLYNNQERRAEYVLYKEDFEVVCASFKCGKTLSLVEKLCGKYCT